ncbi:FAD/NAD(P)-binding domain-containing protein [Aspergillus homomorphus CBS 101889]|uniref:FAD/NAD(P)-binding domain-containing protein n=1 Tax=Aspergillus homomorphus (strain CBS 101889) TaxID=1450537 RepID=A0A395I477_ASPHC|nr:FAD/NAD(P)-binding domain-containing protein [Aspergillus homomorphus CBS 101889]RAL14777.1 FAD/NAD(P)-binding domain-containing protein [Aspergillus homomorphus CBS 101889]
MTDFLVLEKNSGLGGTWYENRYPGCACGIRIALYSLSFEQRRNWTRDYATQKEMLKYLKDVSQKWNVPRYIRLNSTVLEAHWDDHKLQRRSRFPPMAFRVQSSRHTSSRPTSLCASAVQIVPELAKTASQLTIYQRSPKWIVPRKDRSISRAEKNLLTWFSPLRWLKRAVPMWLRESVHAYITNPDYSQTQIDWVLRWMKARVPNKPEGWDALTSRYPLGCTRILV